MKKLQIFLCFMLLWHASISDAYDAAKPNTYSSNIEYFAPNNPATSEQTMENMLIVLSAPSVNDDYYREFFDNIIDFDVRFAQAIMGKDDVVVLADKETMPYLQGRLPDEVLLEAEVADFSYVQRKGLARVSLK